eukprot:sb/3478484/
MYTEHCSVGGRGTEAQTAVSYTRGTGPRVTRGLEIVALCVFQQAERLIHKIGIKHDTNKTESKEVTRNTKIAKSVRNKRIKIHNSGNEKFLVRVGFGRTK